MLTAITYLSQDDLIHSSSLPAAASRRAVSLFCQILSSLHSRYFTRRAATLVASAIPYYYVAYNPLYAGRDQKPQAPGRKPRLK